MNKNKHKRISAAKALKSRWFTSTKNELDCTLSDDVMESLRKYRGCSILKKEALNVLVKLISEDDIYDLRKEFRIIDKDFTGAISAKELEEAFKSTGRIITKSEIKDIINNCDYQENGKINYSEFLAATLSSKNRLSEEMLWALFKHFDSDDNNSITPENIIETLAKSGRLVTQEEIEIVLREHDI